MVVALGIDAVAVARIERALQRKGFLERILTEAERKRVCTAQYVAGRWAAKEAVMKCLPDVVSWRQVEILPDGQGAPTVRFLDRKDRSGLRVMVSITHERDVAVAMAIVEKTL